MKSLGDAFEPDFACKRNCCVFDQQAIMPDECIDCKYYKHGYICWFECEHFHYLNHGYVPYCDMNFHCPEDENGIPIYWDCDDCPHWR